MPWGFESLCLRMKKFKNGDRVEITKSNKFVTKGQTGIVTDGQLINIGKGFWSYSVMLDSPIPGSAPSYMFTDDEIKKL